MKTIKVGMSIITDIESNKCELGYYILAFGNETDPNTYGIMIKCRLCNSDREMLETTCDLTSSYDEAEGWVRMMAAREVGPVSLHEIVDELVG